MVITKPSDCFPRFWR